jgi:hypothetical protein
MVLGNSNMVDTMIENLGLSEWIEKLPNSQYRMSIPKDMNNPSKDNAYQLDLTSLQLMQAYTIMNQVKQYTVNNGASTVKEGDADFDINKWVELMVKQINK